MHYTDCRYIISKMNSATPTFSPSASQSSTQSLSYSQHPTHSYTSTPLSSFTSSLSLLFTSSESPSPSLMQMYTYTYTYTQMQTLAPTVTSYPSTTPTQICRLAPLPTINSTILSSVSDNTFYAVISALAILFLLNLSCSIHYYTEYTNEKSKRKLFDQIHQNPIHSTVRSTFNQV